MCEKDRVMIKITLLVTEKTFASTLHGLIDALNCATRAASEIGTGLEFKCCVASLDGKSVTGSNGYKIEVESALADCKTADVVIAVPALEPMVSDEEVSVAMEPLKGAIEWLRRQMDAGSILASSCTGAFLLAETGLLDGNYATTHWRSADVFRTRYPKIMLQSQDLITDNGSILCGGGATSHVDLSLHLIRRFGGSTLASHCAHNLVVDPGRNLQSPYALMITKTDHDDDMVIKAQQYIAREYSKGFNASDLADVLHVSNRTLARRFKSAIGLPIGLFLQGTRIDAARNKLATTNIPLQAIVLEVGYEDFSSFARLFKAKTGLTMQSYRERFRQQQSDELEALSE